MPKCIVQGIHYLLTGNTCKYSAVLASGPGTKNLSMSGTLKPDFQQNNKVNENGAPIKPTTTSPLRYAFFRTIESAGNDWDAVATRSSDVFLQRPYLQTLELAPPRDIRFGYLVFYADNHPAGIAICQTKRFSAAESITDLSNTPERDPCFYKGVANWLKRRIAGWVDAEILVCGNLMVTGQHGFWFDTTLISPQEIPDLLYKGLQGVIPQFDRNNSKIAMILLKDILPEEQPLLGKYFIKKQFCEFDIQPNMVLHLDDYADFNTYLGAMTTKYRTRAKRAFKKGEALVRKELSKNEIMEAAPEMFALYKSVAKSAGFNVVDLNENYMPFLFKALEGEFRVFGYYLDEKMVSYCTTLRNNEELEAHFLGYDKSLNHDYQLYLNMLYDMIRVAFDSNCCRVVFARTALEIKSSAGAVPEHLYCYLKHQNPLINNFTSNVLEYLTPVEEWRQRHPFKHLQPEHSEDAD